MSKQKQMARKRLDDEEAKYRTLFDSIDEGFVISELLFDEEGKPFDLLVLETNASFERLMQTATSSVGKRALEIFPTAEASWFETYGRVVETGESVRFENYLAALDRWFNLYISRIGEAGSRHFAIVFHDITERKRAETKLAFLAEISQDLVGLTSIDETMNRLGEKIGKFFGVQQCLFAEHADEFETSIVAYGWNVEGAPNLKGTYRTRDYFSDELMTALMTGEPIVVSDTQSDVRVSALRYDALGVRSFILVPLVREGEWRFQMSIVDNAPRNWRDDEIELMRELTTRIWTRLERARSEERLRLIIKSAKGYAIFTTDVDGIINSWNPGAEHTFGWSEVEILGQNVDVLFTPEDRAKGAPQEELETARAEGISPDIRWHQRKDGSRVFINGAVHALRDGRLNGFLKIGRDMTAQRQAEEALRENQKQLQSINETLAQRVQEKTEEVRQLASDVINATQQERQRISRVLHDDLQQRTYAILMQLSFLKDELPGGTHSARKEMSDIEKELAEIVSIMRNLSIDLSPPILPGEGLSHAIEWLASRMREQYGLPIELQANGPFVIADENLHVFLFNCVRELLFNVVKHAEASRAVAALAWLDNGVQIEVRDDGKGFPDHMSEEGKAGKQGDLPHSLGLPTIRHQLSLFGGVMEIISKPGAGTQVILTVPVAEASHGDSSSADRL